MTTQTAVPNAKTFTAAPLRNRLHLELEAPVPDVWALVGAHVRMPEYSAGIASVEIVKGPDGGRVRVCHFRGPDGGEGPALRERIVWESDGVGYAASAEPDNAFGLRDAVELVTVGPSRTGSSLVFEEYYDSSDLDGARASFDGGLKDFGERLIARFGGRVVESFVDGSR